MQYMKQVRSHGMSVSEVVFPYVFLANAPQNHLLGNINFITLKVNPKSRGGNTKLP